MSIFVDETTKVVYQGLTGRRAASTACSTATYGTQVVAGTNPKKAGTDVDGIPVFAIGGRRGRGDRRDRVVHLHPRAGRAGRGDRSGRGRRRVHRVHHRRRARARRGVVLQQAASATSRDAQLLGPNCPGIISPGKCNIGITAGHIAEGSGGPVGIVSRSGTLTYQALYELQAEGHRRHHVRRHRRRPGAGHELHRLPRARSRPTPRPRP